MWDSQDEEPFIPHKLVQRFRTDFLTYLPARLVPAAAGMATVMGVTPAIIWGRWADSPVLRLELSCLAPAVYVGMLFLLREFSREDWAHVWGWLEKRLETGRKQDSR